ncbi:MAG: HAMP domain-containing histidine kinase [Labilithrix sp.]|nr:HAMP domain-containing histidine kinase [Labilithrix sp.]MCW5817900.1 HAMP domain-containing histidine kinase [Labilithrix sp.]
MTDQYFVSFLIVGGVCIGFAMHAASLAVQTRRLRYVYLMLLALLEAAYCFVGWRYFMLTDGARALPWGQAFCAFAPFITWVFGELTMDLSERRPRWLVRLQQVNLGLTTTFATGVVVDMLFRTSITMKPEILTDLESLHRHRFVFTGFGMAYLAWVGVAFSCFAATLLGAYRTRRDLLPMVVGAIVYFSATISDFGICVGIVDLPFTQHFGFFALVIGCWRVISNRFEEAISEMQRAVERLEHQRNRLLIAAPMLHKQKLDSLGTFAAGVGHEINNPIQGIMNYALLIKREAAPETTVSRFADEIAVESKRIADIVQNLLRFARAEGTAEGAVAIAVPVSQLLEGPLRLIRSTLAQRGITLEVHIDDGLPEVTCRAAQVQQVIMNLVTNARDAVLSRAATRTDDKRITVEASQITRAGEPWWVVRVSDTGDGFDPTLSDRIFDPFFTTKGSEGTGLGLSVSHGIVIAHGGQITCESEPARGARFSVAIPYRIDALQKSAQDDVALDGASAE